MLSFISTAHYLQTKQVLAFPVKHFFVLKNIDSAEHSVGID